MSTHEAKPDAQTEAILRQKSVLLVGLGGLGCPAALALGRSGVGRLVLCDDDRVELSNLPRQILYQQADVGQDKLLAAQRALQSEGAPQVELARSRFRPESAARLLEGIDVVVEGADNFATKFLAADACYLARIPVVHGAAIRYVGTALLSRGAGAPCYRCLFEDVPPQAAGQSCDEAGVLGAVTGIVGALMADLAVDAALGKMDRSGSVFTLDGKAQRLRKVSVGARSGCHLCGKAPHRAPIRDLSSSNYWGAEAN